jgi:hypothetical protein
VSAAWLYILGRPWGRALTNAVEVPLWRQSVSLYINPLALNWFHNLILEVLIFRVASLLSHLFSNLDYITWKIDKGLGSFFYCLGSPPCDVHSCFSQTLERRKRQEPWTQWQAEAHKHQALGPWHFCRALSCAMCKKPFQRRSKMEKDHPMKSSISSQHVSKSC